MESPSRDQKLYLAVVLLCALYSKANFWPVGQDLGQLAILCSKWDDNTYQTEHSLDCITSDYF